MCRRVLWIALFLHVFFWLPACESEGPVAPEGLEEWNRLSPPFVIVEPK
jgi:hypothetical protein